MKQELINYLHNKFKEEGKFISKRFIEECLKEERERIIKLFKEDSIYTGAVIKFEINQLK